MQTLHFAKSLINLITVLSFTAVKIFNHRKKNQGQFSLILSPKRYLMLIFVISQEN